MRVSAPARIDLSGGTLDVPPLCWMFEDVNTLNFAVAMRASVSVTAGERATSRVIPTTGEPFAVEDEPLFANALTYFGIEGSVDIHVDTNIPRASGLGGSSSLLTALVASIQLYAGGSIEKKTVILDRVTVLEHRLLGKPAGTQDAVAALYGGLNLIRFDQGRVCRTALSVPDFLNGDIYLAYSSVQHHSGINNWQLIRAVCEGDSHVLSAFHALRNNSLLMKQALLEKDASAFEKALEMEAKLRMGLGEGILTSDMIAFSEALSGKVLTKICGAGGGGCLFLYGDINEPKIEEIASRHHLKIIKTRLETVGCHGDATS